MSVARAARTIARAATTTAAVLAAGWGAYLAGLLAAAYAAPRDVPRAARRRRRFLVVVPARDEEGGIADALRSLRALDYPAEKTEVLVVADHCRDATAAIARAHGARVVERTDGVESKGAALAWALEREVGTADAVAIVDADCTVSPNLLAAFNDRFESGSDAVQCAYRVDNADASPAAALRAAAFAVLGTVRPLGRTRLGLSAGLMGTGMAFSAELLGRAPWRARSMVEDLEQHLLWITAGEQVEFAPEAHVCSSMPTTFADSRVQQRRWEVGRVRLLRRYGPELMLRGGRDRIAALADLVVPPQAALAAWNLLVGLMAAVLRISSARRLVTVAIGSQTAYVLGGLYLAGAPASSYRALFAAPGLMAEKLLILARAAIHGGPHDFARTPRSRG